MSELKLSTELQRTGTVVIGDVSKIPVVGARIDALELGVIEGVEGLEAQLNLRSFRGREWNGFEQG